VSRSWERKVRKNMSAVNKQRKKQGTGNLVLGAEQTEKIVGRNFIMPIFLIMFIAMYLFLVSGSEELVTDTVFWLTIISYIGLAALFFFRRPYIIIGKDYVQSRRLTGHKRLSASTIKAIDVQSSAIVIEQTQGANWIFSKTLNRYPVDKLAEKLKVFAKNNGIEVKEN